MTSFELPLSADVLYLVARGALSHGRIEIFQDSNWTRNDTVKIDVSALYASEAALDSASICHLERQEGHHGIALLSPDQWRAIPYDGFRLEVTVRLPVSSNAAPLRISALETDLPNFAHKIGDFHNEVTFDSLSLHSTNAHISAQSVSAARAEIKTSNSVIEGNFHASESLTLITSNGNIVANVNLYHHDARDAGTSLQMKSSNGAIASEVHLISKAPLPTGGTFNVSALTSNGPLNLHFPVSPLFVHLSVKAQTSNARATVSVDHTFEGAFHVRPYTPSAISFDEHAEDPAGWGRQRSLVSRRIGRAIVGDVSWGPAGSGFRNGSVSVQTTNAPVLLNLL